MTSALFMRRVPAFSPDRVIRPILPLSPWQRVVFTIPFVAAFGLSIFAIVWSIRGQGPVPSWLWIAIGIELILLLVGSLALWQVRARNRRLQEYQDLEAGPRLGIYEKRTTPRLVVTYDAQPYSSSYGLEMGDDEDSEGASSPGFFARAMKSIIPKNQKHHSQDNVLDIENVTLLSSKESLQMGKSWTDRKVHFKEDTVFHGDDDESVNIFELQVDSDSESERAQNLATQILNGSAEKGASDEPRNSKLHIKRTTSPRPVAVYGDIQPVTRDNFSDQTSWITKPAPAAAIRSHNSKSPINPEDAKSHIDMRSQFDPLRSNPVRFDSIRSASLPRSIQDLPSRRTESPQPTKSLRRHSIERDTKVSHLLQQEMTTSRGRPYPRIEVVAAKDVTAQRDNPIGVTSSPPAQRFEKMMDKSFRSRAEGKLDRPKQLRRAKSPSPGPGREEQTNLRENYQRDD